MTYSYCTSETFKTDISQLCANCPLIELVAGYIKNQILFQALERKEILSPKQFDKYINDEIVNAQKAMERTYLNELKLNDSKYRKKRIEIYILNKERIKALKKLSVDDDESQGEEFKQTQHNHIFSNNGFEIFEFLLVNHIEKVGKRGRYSDLAFYYWSLYEDKYIIQRPQQFINWFFEIYEENISKLKTKAQVENGNRKKNYTVSLDYFKNLKTKK